MSRVALLHGLASSFDRNWRDAGWVDVLEDAGHEVVALTLPGHGADRAVADQLPPGPIDGIGFSAGAEALLGVAVARPDTFARLVLMGIGSATLDADRATAAALADALDKPEDPGDVGTRLFRRMAAVAGHDIASVVDYLRRPHQPPSLADLARIRCPVLVVVGDRDPAYPADRLVGALPDAHGVTLRGVDHFATTSDPRAMEAAVGFLAGEN